MSKTQTIKSLLVLPLIASAILLANPVLASNGQEYASHSEVRHKAQGSRPKKGVAGTVTSINGSVIVVTTKDGTKYTVDASKATIMKSSGDKDANPSLVTIADIQVGDTIMVRGTVADGDVTANKIFDGKFAHKHHKHHLKKQP